jgi:TPR repeat protein
MDVRRSLVWGVLCISLAVAPGLARAGDSGPGNSGAVVMPREAPSKLYRPGNSELFAKGVAAFDARYYARAFRIFQQLAHNHDLAAMRNVALMERKGLGTTKDPKAAIKMYREAARRGLVTAAADLGEMLLEGEAGKPDPEAALPWLDVAARAGHPIAQYLLAGMYAEGYGVDRDVKKAELLYAAAAPRLPAAKDKLAALKKQGTQKKTKDGTSGWLPF